MLRGSKDEITFEAPDAIMARIVCTAFRPLWAAIRMHTQNGCSYRVEEKKSPGTWETVFKL